MRAPPTKARRRPLLESFLVVLEDKANALIPYAISAAKALKAHPTAVWPRRDLAGLEDGSLLGGMTPPKFFAHWGYV